MLTMTPRARTTTPYNAARFALDAAVAPMGLTVGPLDRKTHNVKLLDKNHNPVYTVHLKMVRGEIWYDVGNDVVKNPNVASVKIGQRRLR